MFGRIVLFELRYLLRRPAFFVAFGAFALASFLFATALGVAPTGKGPVDDQTLPWFTRPCPCPT
jgi:hypothetical protein